MFFSEKCCHVLDRISEILESNEENKVCKEKCFLQVIQQIFNVLNLEEVLWGQFIDIQYALQD